jgi:transcriptional regulator GlxA family with amidase domain
MTLKIYDIVVFLYPGMTALDAIGPYEVLRAIPNARIRFAAKTRGPVEVDSGFLSLHAEFSISEIDSADILLVPGGNSLPQLDDPEVLAWIRRIHETTRWTTSVCTGSLILAGAGVLEGMEATTHWSSLPILADFGAKPCERRVVRHGKVVTAAGVSAGIDMGLELVGMEAGEEVAKTMQLIIEYDPAPPFDAGSPAKAGEAILNRAKAILTASQARSAGA